MSTPTNGNGFTQKYAVIIQTVTVVALFAAGGWTVGLSPIQTMVKDLQVQMADLRVSVSANTVRIETNARDIREINVRHVADVVPRSESDANKKHTEETLALLSDRLNDLRSKALTTVTVSDELKRLQTDIVEMRRQLSEKR